MAHFENRLSTTVLPDDYIPPNGQSNHLLEWHEGGPIAVGDTSAGQNFQGWVMTYSDPDFILTPDTIGGPVIPLSVAGVTQLSFCFDQNARATIYYTLAGIAKLYWFDTMAGMFVTTESTEGAVSAALTLDDKRSTQTQANDMLLYYTKQQPNLSYTLFMRRQRDRFETDFFQRANVLPHVVNLGMHKSLRVQLSLQAEFI